MNESVLIIVIIVLAMALVVMAMLLFARGSRSKEDELKAFAADMLHSDTDWLRAENARQLQALLSPLQQSLTDFRRAVSESYVNENAARRSLTDQIDRLMQLNRTIGDEARNLTAALTGNSKVQGDWGEMILTRVLEQAGLQNGVHFTTQVTRDSGGEALRNEQGRLLRPDVVVHLPDGREMIIDSKVSLTAYARAYGAKGDEHDALIKEHVASVRRHIDELAAKRYQDYVKNAAGFVLMFIPNEGAYLTALRYDDSLQAYASARNVALVGGTHLMAVLQLVDQLWVQDHRSRHTLKIAEKGGSLYDKVMLFLESMQEVGKALENAVRAHETAMQRLATGRGSVASLSRELGRMGVKTRKKMPDAVAARLDSDDDDESSEDTAM